MHIFMRRTSFGQPMEGAVCATCVDEFDLNGLVRFVLFRVEVWAWVQ